MKRRYFWTKLAFLLIAATSLLAALVGAQSQDTTIQLPPPPANFLDDFPPSYRAIPPFQDKDSYADPENAIVADRQRGYLWAIPDQLATNNTMPLVAPRSGIPAITNIICATNLPPSPDSQEVANASRFVLERAYREDVAFDETPNVLMECFDDVFPHGAEWLKHKNAKISTVTSLIDAIYLQCISPETGAAKTYWHRKRPIASGDTRIQYLNLAAIQAAARDEAAHRKIYDVYTDVASFPSGHSTTGMVDALVLADIAPQTYRAALLARGVAIGDDRVLLGVHYPSDVAAGRYLAEAIYNRLAADANYRRAVIQARAQFQAELDYYSNLPPVSQPTP